jgi:hypothetical protein
MSDKKSEIINLAKSILEEVKKDPKAAMDSIAKAAANPDEKADAQLGEEVEHKVIDHLKENKAAEAKEGHDFRSLLMEKWEPRYYKPDLNKAKIYDVGGKKLADLPSTVTPREGQPVVRDGAKGITTRQHVRSNWNPKIMPEKGGSITKKSELSKGVVIQGKFGQKPSAKPAEPEAQTSGHESALGHHINAWHSHTAYGKYQDFVQSRGLRHHSQDDAQAKATHHYGVANQHKAAGAKAWAAAGYDPKDYENMLQDVVKKHPLSPGYYGHALSNKDFVPHASEQQTIHKKHEIEKWEPRYYKKSELQKVGSMGAFGERDNNGITNPAPIGGGFLSGSSMSTGIRSGSLGSGGGIRMSEDVKKALAEKWEPRYYEKAKKFEGNPLPPEKKYDDGTVIKSAEKGRNAPAPIFTPKLIKPKGGPTSQAPIPNPKPINRNN